MKSFPEMNDDMINKQFQQGIRYILSQQPLPKVIFIRMSKPEKTPKPSFIQEMQLCLNEYQVKRIQRLEQQQARNILHERENDAKMALIELDEVERNRAFMNDADDIGSWNFSKPLADDIKRETDREWDRGRESQRITIMSVAQPLKKSNYRSVNNRALGMQAINTQNTVIPQLKFLLERLSSPIKKKKENNNVLVTRFGSTTATSSKARLKVAFKERQNIKTRQCLGNYERHDTLDREKDCFRVPTNTRDEIVIRDWKGDYKTTEQAWPSKELNFEAVRAMTSKQQRKPDPMSKAGMKRNLLRTNQAQNMPNQQFYHQPVPTSQTQPLANHSGNKVANFEYGKIKRKHPSTYEIDIAHEKEILQQLIRGTTKSFSSSKQSSSRKRYVTAEKFTLANLLQ